MPRKEAGGQSKPRARPNRIARSGQKPADVRSAGHGAKSEAVREQAILALLSERTNAKAAAKCGVNARTLHRWLTKDEAFKSAYAEARQATLQAGMSRVQALTARGLSTRSRIQHPQRWRSRRPIATVALRRSPPPPPQRDSTRRSDSFRVGRSTRLPRPRSDLR